jgi:phosphopantetheinyl transferase (holo-ACP synthase)
LQVVNDGDGRPGFAVGCPVVDAALARPVGEFGRARAAGPRLHVVLSLSHETTHAVASVIVTGPPPGRPGENE